jgi:hypothetical protein
MGMAPPTVVGFGPSGGHDMMIKLPTWTRNRIYEKKNPPVFWSQTQQ